MTRVTRSRVKHSTTALQVNVITFQTLYSLFSAKMLVVRAGIHKMLVRIANRQYPDLTSLIWVCAVLLGLFGMATSVRNFRTSTVHLYTYTCIKYMSHILKKKRQPDTGWVVTRLLFVFSVRKNVRLLFHNDVLSESK